MDALTKLAVQILETGHSTVPTKGITESIELTVKGSASQFRLVATQEHDYHEDLMGMLTQARDQAQQYFDIYVEDEGNQIPSEIDIEALLARMAELWVARQTTLERLDVARLYEVGTNNVWLGVFPDQDQIDNIIKILTDCGLEYVSAFLHPVSVG